MDTFYDDIIEDGYHIFSRSSARINDFYPNKFPDYPGAKLRDLKVGDEITIRAFFPIGKGEPIRIDGGYVDLEIEHVDSDHLIAVILTKLPDDFILKLGGSIEIREDEILYKKKGKKAH